jgi:hypothetical protein
MYRLLRASAVFLLLTHVLCGAEKNRDWQAGKVLDSERSRHFAGMVGQSNTSGTVQGGGNYGTYGSNTNTSQTAVYKVYETFVIEGQNHVYLAQQRLRWRWSKPANLTVNGPIKFAVEKRKMFIVDDDDKEHELEIQKRVLRQTPEQR